MKILILAFTLFMNIKAVFAQSIDQQVIQKSLSINSKVEQVWSALTQEAALSKWWNQGVRLDPYVGGDFYEPWGDDQLATGVVQFVKPLKQIRFSWKEKYWIQGQNTICQFSIEPNGNSTQLSVEHSGWEVFGDSSSQMSDGFSKGWDQLLPKLKNYIEKN